MTIREQLDSIARERVLILDGAMGSMIQAFNFEENDFRGMAFAGHSTALKGCNDVLCLTKPAAISAIHDAYLEAGADIIETCSFNATTVSLSSYGLDNYAYEISAAAAQLARKSADKYSTSAKPRFVAGSIGPTAKGASLYPDISDLSRRSITWDELAAAYYDNARGLVDGGADILLIETVFDPLNAKAAIFAISRLQEERRAEIPIMISATISGESGRLLSGQSLEAFCISVLHANPWAIGLNCSFGAEKLLPHIRLLSEICPCMVSAHPNAGFPNQLGIYEETPECMAACVEIYLEERLVNITGGCCGTTPAHIAAIAAKAAVHKPRLMAAKSFSGRFSGLEPLTLCDDVIRVGQTQDAATSAEFLRLARDGEFEDATEAARDMVDSGANIIDINIDDANIMEKFLDHSLFDPHVARAPCMINSVNWNVLESGLKRLPGKGLAKAINLKDGEEAFFRRAELIRRYGAMAVVTLVDEQGGAETGEREIEIARRVYELLRRKNYPADNIVFAPQTSAESAEVCSWIRNNCPGVLLLLTN